VLHATSELSTQGAIDASQNLRATAISLRYGTAN